MPVNLFVYLCLLSRWKRIAKINLEKRRPIITVNAEFAKSLVEYFVDTYATSKLITKPTMPESNRFLLRDIML